MGGVFSSRPLDGHEVLVAQSAREMMASGDYLVPSFNDEARLKKPPLMYWLVIGVAKVIPGAGDVPEWAARLPSWLAGIALVGVTMALGWRLGGRAMGVLAGLLLATSVGYFTLTNSARPEMVYGALGGLATLGFVRATLAEDRTAAQRRGALVGWIGFALATLAKGPHLPGLILFGVMIHLLLSRQGERLSAVVRPFTGLVVFALIVGPWAAALIVHAPETVDVWYHELIGNSSGDEGSGLLAHVSAYYLHAPFRLLLPWAPCVVLGLFAPWSKRSSDFAAVRVLFWIVIATLVVMTIPDHRRWYYLIPIAPALAVMSAAGTLGAMRVMTPSRTVRMFGTFMVLLIVFGAGAALIEVSQPMRVGPAVVVVMALVIGAAVMAAVSCRRAACGVTVGAAVFAWAALFTLTGHLHGWWGEQRYEEWRFAEVVAERVPDDDPLYTWRVDEAVLVYATDRPVERVRDLEDIDDHPPEETIWVVTREEFADDVSDEWRSWIIHESPPGAEDGYTEVLLALRARTDPGGDAGRSGG